jgi:tetratricopeptide (TPR) repeat protein
MWENGSHKETSGAIRSGNRLQAGAILFLISVGMVLQGFVTSSQAGEPGRRLADDPVSGSHSLRAQDTQSQTINNQPEAAYNAAKLMISEGRPTAAIGLIQATLKRRHTRDNTTFSLELLLAETDAYVGQDKQASEVLNSLVAERPDSAEVHLDLALAYARLGLLPAAIKQFQEELRLQPQNRAGLLGVAKAFINEKKSSDAFPFLRKYIELRPKDAQGYYVLGRALFDTGDYKEAVEKLREAARFSPGDYDIRFHLGMALWRSGEPELAQSQFEVAERLNPGRIQVHSVLARILWSLGRWEQAKAEGALAERLSSLKQSRDRASYSIAKGNVFLASGDLQRAAQQFREASRLNPKSAGARYNLGLALARLNDPQDARHEFQGALLLDPKFAPAYNALGISYKRAGQLSKADAAFEQAIRLNPQYAEAKNNLGTLYAMVGKNGKAAALFKEAAEDSPQYPMPYLNWGLLLANQGDLKQAKRMLERALRCSPHLVEARKALQAVDDALHEQN